jgi:hypothetical protein
MLNQSSHVADKRLGWRMDEVVGMGAPFHAAFERSIVWTQKWLVFPSCHIRAPIIEHGF